MALHTLGNIFWLTLVHSTEPVVHSELTMYEVLIKRHSILYCIYCIIIIRVLGLANAKNYCSYEMSYRLIMINQH